MNMNANDMEPWQWPEAHWRAIVEHAEQRLAKREVRENHPGSSSLLRGSPGRLVARTSGRRG